MSLSNESLSTLAVGNGQALSDRVALKQLVVQLLDDHGNCAAPQPGVEVRVRPPLPPLLPLSAGALKQPRPCTSMVRI